MLTFEEQQQNTTHTVFVDAFNKRLTKQLCKPIDAQDLLDSEKVSAIWVKNLNSFVGGMNSTKSLIIIMKSKDAIKLDIIALDKSETSRGKRTTRKWLIQISIAAW